MTSVSTLQRAVSVTSGIATKYLVPMGDGILAEVTRVERPDKTIVCYSTQVGCSIGCAFCASGRGNIRGNLSAGQMSGLIEEALRGHDRDVVVLLSAMGEGEPSQNPIEVAKVMGSYGRGYRHAVSTSGPSPRLVERLLSYLEDCGVPVKLQYSLHTAVPSMRRAIMPNALAESGEILPILAVWPDVELNVVLWNAVNDSVADAEALADLLDRNSGPSLWRIKLNRANPVQGGLRPALPGAVQDWAATVIKRGYRVEAYATDGADIQAACGQLRWKGESEAAERRAR